MAEDYEAIQSVTSRGKSANPYEKWNERYQQWLNLLGNDMSNPEKDPFQSEAGRKVVGISSTIFGQCYRDMSNSSAKYLDDEGVPNLSKRMKPGWAQYGTLGLSTLFGVAAGALNIVPGAAGFSQATTGIFNGASGISSALGGGAGGLNGIFQSLDHSKQPIAQHDVDNSKRTMEESRQAYQTQENIRQRQQEQERQLQEEEYRTWESMARNS